MSRSATTPAPRPGLTRRQFSLDAAMALVAGCVITVTEGCGSSSTPTTPTPVDIAASVSTVANHTHTGTVTGAQISAGSAVTITLVGAATHNHTVALSQSDLTALKNRQAVSHDSSNDNAHVHTVTFTPS